MSRKWERMVEKNRKTANKRRLKQGQERISYSGTEEVEVFRGRSWILPLVLILFAAAYALAFYGYYDQDTSFWITVACYGLLGLFLFAFRRPILRIGRNRISSRRFAGDKWLEPGEIDEIILSPRTAVIQLKEKRVRWIFTRFLHRMPIGDLSARLREYAARHGVKLTEQSK
ncbi:hypothetical protein MJA45_16020 [Paenibacillus aurantius]|uniref:Methyltransferase n=1 Tax=Paenibacillus aurantius TaxID=2918900 RepID=A0AA96LBQ6_9BACL|nr:hypothetical protein [Paenibacillus aurantius]WNQ09151.1 hypothetical protein MJA45_16020 [Paenibacillus aurantius]